MAAVMVQTYLFEELLLLEIVLAQVLREAQLGNEARRVALFQPARTWWPYDDTRHSQLHDVGT